VSVTRDQFWQFGNRMPTYIHRCTFGMDDRQLCFVVHLLRSWRWRNEHDWKYRNPNLFKRAVNRVYRDMPNIAEGITGKTPLRLG